MSNQVIVYPEISKALITNPGIGFIASPQLMGEVEIVKDNKGNEARKYKFTKNSKTWNHPDSKVYYCGVTWKEMEPKKGEYRWDILEKKLDYAKSLGCTAVVRCLPYTLSDEEDIPTWYRMEYKEEPEFPFWRVDPVTTPYVEYWSEFIENFGDHFDGHPLISSVDMAIVGAWGEGGGTEFLEEQAIRRITDAYINHFKITPMQALLHDPKSLKIINERNETIGFRVDCLGDMGGFHGDEWSHMLDFYPQNIQNFNMGDSWKKAPVVFEACWHMNDWYNQGWDIDYIIDESLKWHISSYNSKGTTVPYEWKDSVERWLLKMGYRFEIRKFTYEQKVKRGQSLPISILTANVGVAPIYHNYPLTIRLRNNTEIFSFAIKEDIREWLPDMDILCKESILIPSDIPCGEYIIEIGIETGIKEIGNIKFAISGEEDGYYPMGKISIE
ncbi:uncharacterized protein DUF4832 [Mobilisporobacter senegalensis]|uniref:Uncharacterized protein DUF4832 n=1 Tax=Mobilisporobacter senegalensis TaxID=1329262 RepID=A0A3N1XQQ0_9FIRM|nr:DUF4832 domain-containing protein [Mobilisporobacter senegalensis]ROR27402.1 uncharacterized protein DUF4832 [Mobilisporobacter senegalensis]